MDGTLEHQTLLVAEGGHTTRVKFHVRENVRSFINAEAKLRGCRPQSLTVRLPNCFSSPATYLKDLRPGWLQIKEDK
jgi:hypothetical protein